MKVKFKKTRVNFLKDSQKLKLKYASLAGGNALAMTLFYSLVLL
jgi:hypothetical protein